MKINSKFTLLRNQLRQQSKNIIHHILQNHISLNGTKTNTDICIFCNATNNLTKEHVLPKWTFEKDTERFFTTDVNGSEQTYNRTTVPVCSDCNNGVLAFIESYIIATLQNTNLNTTFFTNEEVQNIIRWLEIIEYKFHVLEARRKFIKHKSTEYISVLADIPISVMRKNIDYSPAKAVAQLRLSQRRVRIKDKTRNENLLVVFESKNKSFHFFHQMNEYIFIELPQFKIALLYFYSKTFELPNDAYNNAMEIINHVYNF